MVVAPFATFPANWQSIRGSRTLIRVYFSGLIPRDRLRVKNRTGSGLESMLEAHLREPLSNYHPSSTRTCLIMVEIHF